MWRGFETGLGGFGRVYIEVLGVFRKHEEVLGRSWGGFWVSGFKVRVTGFGFRV